MHPPSTGFERMLGGWLNMHLPSLTTKNVTHSYGLGFVRDDGGDGTAVDVYNDAISHKFRVVH